MELLYAIAEVLDVPNEWIVVDRALDNIIWFHVGSVAYTCKTSRGKFLKAHSIRVDNF